MKTRTNTRRRAHVPVPAPITPEPSPSPQSTQRAAPVTSQRAREDQEIRGTLEQVILASSETSQPLQFMQPLVECIAQELLARLIADFPTQCVIHVSLNARGRAQFELRRAYPTLQLAKEEMRRDIKDLTEQVRLGLQDTNVKLASED